MSEEVKKQQLINLLKELLIYCENSDRPALELGEYIVSRVRELRESWDA